MSVPFPEGGDGSSDLNSKERRVQLSPPWVHGDSNIIQTMGGDVNDASVQAFIQARSQVHESYIKEEAKNKRLGLALAATLILSATLILVFAPPGREQLSYWIGAALLLFAAGAAGYKRVWGRTPVLSFGADSATSPVPERDR